MDKGTQQRENIHDPCSVPLGVAGLLQHRDAEEFGEILAGLGNLAGSGYA